jgi:DNA polymerase IV (DinB-like DNA polymerase)
MLHNSRIVLHIDMDAFFAAVEERERPWLKDLPVVIGADPKEGEGRGVVSTANYKAREYGIHSAQPISIAWRLSEKASQEGKPKAAFLSPNFPLYEKISHEIMDYLKTKGDKFEAGGIDEAYIEMKNGKWKMENVDPWAEAVKIAKEMKECIKETQRLTCSVGIGPNKLIAKIASGFKKPDGLTIVKPERIQEFLDPLPADTIPGIGPKSKIVLEGIGVETIADLKKLSKETLENRFGKWGLDMYQRAHGIDETPVGEPYETKSIGKQITFEKDTLDPNLLISQLKQLAREVFEEVREQKFRFKTVEIAVRFRGFETKTRSRTIKDLPQTTKAVETEALRLFLPFLDRRENPRKKLIRLIGVRVTK